MNDTMKTLGLFVVAAVFTVLPVTAQTDVERARDSGDQPMADSDFDGIEDSSDNCQQLFNPDQTDTDADGLGDACDQDDDNDGVRDSDGGGSAPCPTTDTCLPDAVCSLGGNECTGPTDCLSDDQDDFCIEIFGECSQSKAPCQTTADCPPLVDTCQRECDSSAEPCTTDAECTVTGCDDNCPLSINPLQTDMDGDEIGDVCDNCAFTSNTPQDDLDSDGLGDACDPDIDGDGQAQDVYGVACSVIPNPNGTPGPNSAMFVCSDGITACTRNIDCPLGETCPCDDNCSDAFDLLQYDHDGDSVGSVCDNCLSTMNSSQLDNDFDGLGNSCDNCIDDSNPNQENEDADLFGDACDNCDEIGNNSQGDDDFDDVGNVCDNCALAYNPSQQDSDTDDRGDVCDPCPLGSDDDGDGVCSDVDNCPSTTNSNQNDLDGDGIGNACDCDRDGDGVGDKVSFPFGAGSRTCGTCAGGNDAGRSCLRSADCAGSSCRTYEFGFLGHCSTMTCNQQNGNYPACGTNNFDSFCSALFGDIDPPCCLDNCPADFNAGQANGDGDGQGDVCDPSPTAPQTPAQEFPLLDLDGDDWTNQADNCHDRANYEQVDFDLDQLGDVCDGDLDGDLAANGADNCLFVFNPAQANNDLDLLGDACDNCPFDANGGQTDADLDGIGDRCDDDDERVSLYLEPGGIAVWEQEVGYSDWILIRGDLAVLRATGDYIQAAAPLVGVDCHIGASANVDSVVVAPGETVFFVAGGFIGTAERGFGNHSDGVQRIIEAVCE